MADTRDEKGKRASVKARSVIKERRIMEKTEGGNILERLNALDYIGLWGGVGRELCHRS